ncbi:MAG: Cof-type HAD-IIB family hydrolase [Nitrosopumilus sp.]|nr:Cof-type HAD-IIB family hydrolase [Nitrosopumilus sp.]MDA7942616.1 Cof-type HAD-IIB family hydrolase [Nitrosopumilus sp.]
MEIHIKTGRSKDEEVLKQVKEYGRITSRRGKEIILESEGKLKKLLDELGKIKGVTDVYHIKPHLKKKGTKIKEAFRLNRCVLVFDVDSTLTRGSPGTIHPKIKPIFDSIRARGIWIFIATGRSMSDAINLSQEYGRAGYAIAENGGIITGFGKAGYHKFGDKKEPKKILEYLREKYRVREDMDQDIRITEVIFKKKDVSMKKIREAKNSTKVDVDIHASKNAYHISKHAINKGTAMLWLVEKLDIGDQLVIAVGDADMDIPMFKLAGYSYAVGNASNNAKKAAKSVLKGKYEKSIEDLFKRISDA